jgi:hypothetical protein
VRLPVAVVCGGGSAFLRYSHTTPDTFWKHCVPVAHVLSLELPVDPVQAPD